MAKLTWDNVGERFFETGIDRGVLFPMGTNGTYESGVAWSGLTSVEEAPTGAEATPLYADNIKYLNLLSNEDFAFTIGAYTYPDEFAECDGSAALAKGVQISQQKRKQFGFSYRTRIGNDVDGDDHGYKIHLVYGCLAAPSSKSRNTVNDSPEATEMSWEVSTTPINVEGFKPTAHIVIDSTKADSTKLAALEAKLYGGASEEATLPLPAELITLMGADEG